MRILICYELGRGYGHVARVSSIAQALYRLGHRIDVALPDKAALDAIDKLGIRAIHFAPHLTASLNVHKHISSIAQIAANFGFACVDALGSLTRDWRKLFRMVRPDLVICEYAPSALFACNLAGIPAARVGTGFFTPPRGMLPNLRPWANRSESAGLSADCSADRAMRTICKEFRVPETDFRSLLDRAPPFWTTWPEIDHLGPREGTKYFGPLRSQNGIASPKWPLGGDQHVFVYMPNKGKRAELIRDTLTILGWSTVWHTQSNEFEKVTTGETGQIYFHCSPLNIDEVLAIRPLIVSRAGHGLAAQAIRYGCKQVFIPDRLEGALLAYRMRQQHLGVSLPPINCAKAVADYLIRVAGSAQMELATSRASIRYRRYDPDITTFKLVESLLASTESN